MDKAVSVGSRSPRADLLRLALLIAAVFTGALIWAGCGGQDQPAELTGMTRNPQLIVEEASLPQQNPDRPVADNRLRGPQDGLMLLYFGYTFCPDVCPTTFSDLRLALSKLEPAQKDRIEVAMATVDPKRDTAKVMNRYLGHFFDPGRFATFRPSDPAQLKQVEQAFGVAHRYGKPDENGNYEVEHSAQVFAIDHEGRVLVEWPFGSQPENIASDIRLLLERIDEGTLNQESES